MAYKRGIGGKRIDAVGRYTIVAIENGRPIGTVSYSAARFPKMEGYGEINSIYLLAEYIGKGYDLSFFSKYCRASEVFVNCVLSPRM